ARDTQLFLQNDTDITKAIDPWGGSYYVESLTEQLIQEARTLMSEIDSAGGMPAAIEAGIPKLRIEEAAARKQARIDAGAERIVGVNIFQTNEQTDVELLEIDNDAVREGQITRLTKLKAERNEAKTQAALRALTKGAKDQDNLLELAVTAARERASLGEISSALEEVFGRYRATNRIISGVYSQEMKHSDRIEQVRQLAAQFQQLEGRRPRIMIAKLGQDGHDRGAKVIATGFADLGFDVDVGPLFQTPAEAARQAVENDVHLLGISSLAAGHKTLVPETIAELKQYGREDVLVIVGGVIPPNDYQFLYDEGVAGVFGPGTN
ncbi:MAG: methylmalonyl-CoA mutase family protein, partial [Bacteroidota bacterium]